MTVIYTPQTSLPAKVRRRLARVQARRLMPVRLDHSIVSFSFDDCPKSVIDNALKPIEAEGWLATIYVAMGLCGITNHLGLHMSPEDVKALCDSGHAIGDHTYSHCDAFSRPLDYVLKDIEKNQEALSALGVPPSETFAYPFGELTPALKTALAGRFKGSRGILKKTHETQVDLNQIGSYPLYHGDDFDLLMRRIADLKENPGWMTLFTHDVRENPSAFGCTPAQLKTVIDAVKDTGAQVMPIANAIDQLEVAA